MFFQKETRQNKLDMERQVVFCDPLITDVLSVSFFFFFVK